MQKKAKALLTKNGAFSLYCLDFSIKIWLIFCEKSYELSLITKTFSRIVCKWYIFKFLLLYGKFQWHICSHIRGKEVALHLYQEPPLANEVEQGLRKDCYSICKLVQIKRFKKSQSYMYKWFYRSKIKYDSFAFSSTASS